MIYPLLPKKLEKGEGAYKAVEELAYVLDNAEKLHIRNVAVAGPFGSGKSSVITTLMDDRDPKNHTYLSISLATLKGDNDENDENDKKNIEADTQTSNEIDSRKTDTVRIENLNRQIEYSILQQIIYKEKADKLPNSRFRKINHYSKIWLSIYSLSSIITMLALIYVFGRPSVIIDTLYCMCNLLDPNNTLIRFIGVCWLVVCLFFVIIYIIKLCGNLKLKRINIDNGIELEKDTSVFNKHLDEILYFFQVTKYKVVIIEDLDRFDPSADIFLKLRELNQLINESKIVGRHITFVYAIKNDVFKEVDRTKFFDYIITIIPVINHSNSKDKLKEALNKRNFDENEISDDDLSEIAFFITDMRMLINIVNEYKQYRNRLFSSDTSKLNPTKLLAMIVYKNYYPKDFDELQYRKGKVYTCISKKNEFIKEALKNIDQQRKKLKDEEKLYKDNCILRADELRIVFLHRLREKYNKNMKQIYIETHWYPLEKIENNKELFKLLLTSKTVSFNDIYGKKIPSVVEKINELNNEMNLSERLLILEKGSEYYKSEHKRLQEETIAIQPLRLSELLNKYITGENKLYTEIGLDPLPDIFIRRGYIDEDYYDYISYFYVGTLSHADRDLLLSIKQQKALSPDYHIDKKESFVKELKDYMFDSDAILNNELLDYLAEHKEEQQNKFDLIIRRIERKDVPLQFLAQYYEKGHRQKTVFEHFINSDKDGRWKQITDWKDDAERNILIEAYLKFCNELKDAQQKWLNNNYSFIAKRVESIGLDRCLILVSKSEFTEINSGNDSLLDCIIEYDSYRINSHNLWIVTQTLCKGDKSITEENLNYTRLCACQNESLKNYIDKNIEAVISCIKDKNKDESVESILSIINNENIDSKLKEDYLSQQTNQISNFNEITDVNMYDIAVSDYLIAPTWENVTIYFKHNGELTDELAKYINHFADKLSKSEYTDDDNVIRIFVALSMSNDISPENYRNLLKSFNIMFPDCAKLKSIDKKRLQVLIDNGKIAFKEDTIKVMNDTPVLAEYLIYYSKELVNNLQLPYKITEDVASKLLQSNAFSLEEKVKIIDIIPNDIRKKNQIADMLIPIYIESKHIDKNIDVALILIKKADSIKTKVTLAILFIKANPDKEKITQVLQALGGEYSDITKQNKNPKLDKEEYNIELLTILRNRQYISSFKEPENDKKEKNYIRVYTKR